LFGRSDHTPDIPRHPRAYRLVADCGDNWEDIPLKIYYGIRALYNLGFSGIIKLDENVCVSDAARMVETVQDELRTHPYITLMHVGGIEAHPKNNSAAYATVSHYHYNKTSDKRFNGLGVVTPCMQFAGGPAYAIRDTAVNMLTKDDFMRFIFEDYALAFSLRIFNDIYVHRSKLCDEKLLTDPDAEEFTSPLTVPTTIPCILKFPPPTPRKKCYMVVEGGLGNQLFQIATAVAYSQRNDFDCALVMRSGNARGYYWDPLLPRCKHAAALPRDYIVYNEPTFEYSELPRVDQNILITGYFQSSRYFSEFKHLIRELLCWPADARTKLVEKYGAQLFSERAVVVHARRGDYCSSPELRAFHGPLDTAYYERALAHLRTVGAVGADTPFILVSDDPTYWTTNTVFAAMGNPCIHVNEDTLTTFYLLAHSRYYILSNSTFAWWGAYLSPAAAQVVAPAQWFGPAGPSAWSTLYEKEWTVL
jgi:hypothetical protein